MVGTVYNWADNLSNYDSICIVSSSLSDLPNDIIWNHFFDVPNILEAGMLGVIAPYSTRSLSFEATDTTFRVNASGVVEESATYAPVVYKIYGYKGG